MENGVKVGTLRTQLGINGFEEEGPMIAAKTLLNYLKLIIKIIRTLEMKIF